MLSYVKFSSGAFNLGAFSSVNSVQFQFSSTQRTGPKNITDINNSENKDRQRKTKVHRK